MHDLRGLLKLLQCALSPSPPPTFLIMKMSYHDIWNKVKTLLICSTEIWDCDSGRTCTIACVSKKCSNSSTECKEDLFIFC